MSAARGGASWKFVAGGFVIASLAAAFGVPVVELAGAIAVPALGVAGLGLMVGIEDLWTGGGRVAFTVIATGIAAQSIGGALAIAFTDQRFQVVCVLAVLLVLLVAAVRLLGAMASVKLPEPRRIGKTPIRERVEVVKTVEGAPFERPPAPDNDDELGAWRRRR